MPICRMTFPFFRYYFTKNKGKRVVRIEKIRVKIYTNEVYKMSKYYCIHSAIMRIYQILYLNYTIVINYVQLHVR